MKGEQDHANETLKELLDEKQRMEEYFEEERQRLREIHSEEVQRLEESVEEM